MLRIRRSALEEKAKTELSNGQVLFEDIRKMANENRAMANELFMRVRDRVNELVSLEFREGMQSPASPKSEPGNWCDEMLDHQREIGDSLRDTLDVIQQL